MKFAAFVNDEIEEKRSLDPLDLELSYNEKEVIQQNQEFIFGGIKIKNIEFREKGEGCDIEGSENSILGALPGKPSVFFY
jgi:hypothetical protein